MKMLFSSRDRSEIKSLRQELTRAGIRCQVRQNRIAQGAFGIPPLPELWIQRDTDILKALRKLGTRRLRDMTVIFSKAPA
jgi:putative signal transducing protein